MPTEGSFLKLRPEVEFVVTEEGVYLDGLSKPELIRGVAASTLLPLSLELLRKGCAASDLYAQLQGTSAAHVEELVATLRRWNLFCSAPDDAEAADPSERFIRRIEIDAGRGSERPLRDTRANANVQIGAAPSCLPIAYELKRLLDRTMIRTDLSSFDSGKEFILLTRSDRCSLAVRYRIEVNTDPVGLTILREADDEDMAGHLAGSAETDRVSSRVLYYASCICWEIVQSLASSRVALRVGECRHYSARLSTGAPQRRVSLSSIGGNSDFRWRNVITGINRLLGPGLIEIFAENSIVMRNDRPYNQDEFLSPHRTRLFEAQMPQTALIWDAFSTEGCARGAPFDERVIATILQKTGGLRENEKVSDSRWIPSGGNLGSVRLNLLTLGRGTLLAGIYTFAYVDNEATLVNRSSLKPENVERLMEAILPESDKDTDLIIQTGRQYALRPKYGHFSFKLAHLDGGVAFAQMQLISKTFGLEMEPILGWPLGVLDEPLNLSGRDECVCSISTLRRRGKPSVYRQRRELDKGEPRDRKVIGDLYTMEELVNLLQEGERQEHYHWMTEGQNLGVKRSRPSLSERYIKKKLQFRSDKRVCDVIARRVSTRVYGREPIPLDGIGEVLALSIEQDRREWPEGAELMTLVLQRDFDDQTVDVLLCDDEGKLHQRCVVSNLQVKELFSQQEFDLAPVTVIVGASVQIGGDDLLPSDYRRLLFRCGSLSHRLHLGCVALGFVSCIHAGFDANTWAAFSEYVGMRILPLIGCSIGYPSSIA